MSLENRIHECSSLSQLRQMFKKTSLLITQPDVHNALFERLNYLRNQCVSKFETESFDYLQEEILDELENAENNQLRAAHQLKNEYKTGSELLELPKSESDVTEAEMPTFGLGFLKNFDVTLHTNLVHQLEKELILTTLYKCGDNRTQAAKHLGISIRTLRNKMHEYKREAAQRDQIGLVEIPYPEMGQLQ